MASPNDEGTSSTSKENAKRGMTRKQKNFKAKSAGVRKEVEWNARGQPIGLSGDDLVSYIGVTVRSLVPLYIDNWRPKEDDVLKTYKANVWEKILEAFAIEDEHNNYVMREAGKLHRAFRTRVSKSLKDNKGNFIKEIPKECPKEYSEVVEQEEWSVFVAKRTTDVAKKVSMENRKRALNPQYPYRKSRRGYAQLEHKMLQEMEKNEEIEEMEPELLTVPRHVVWKAGHVNKKGVIDNKNVQKVWDQCEKLAQSLSKEGEDFGTNDILSQVLNVPEHSGRVRALGFAAKVKIQRSSRPTKADFENLKSQVKELNMRMCMYDKNSRQERQQNEEVVENQQPEKVVKNQQPKKVVENQQLEKVVERQQDEEVVERQQHEEVVERQQHEEVVKRQQPKVVVEKLRDEFVKRQQPDEVVEKHQRSAKDSCNITALDTIPNGISACNIYLDSPIHHLVARGKLYNTPGDVIHTKKLPSGYVKVNIEVFVDGKALLPIPVENGDIKIVSQAIGTLVAWPFRLIEIVAERRKIPAKCKNIGNNIQLSTESIASPNKNRGKMKKQDPSPKVGGSTHTPNFRFLEMYAEVIMTRESIIPVKMDECIFGEQFVENIDSGGINALVNHRCLDNSVITVYMRYLYDKLLCPRGLINKFSFLSVHSTFLDVDGQMIADLLSKRKDLKDNLTLVPYNYGAIILYRTERGAKVSRSKLNKITWTKIQCPCQTNQIDCGYYVMRFMKEIINANQNKIPIEYFPDYKCASYSKAKLVEVKEDWATYMIDEFIRKSS